MSKMIRVRELKIDIPKEAMFIANQMLTDLEKSKRPILEAVKTSLDNSLQSQGWISDPGRQSRSNRVECVVGAEACARRLYARDFASQLGYRIGEY